MHVTALLLQDSSLWFVYMCVKHSGLFPFLDDFLKLLVRPFQPVRFVYSSVFPTDVFLVEAPFHFHALATLWQQYSGSNVAVQQLASRWQ